MLTGDMLRRSASRFPGKPAIIWDDRRITYRELDAAADRFANALRAAGLHKGAKVAMLCRNRLEYGIVFFGAARSGCVLVNVSVLYSADELAYVLDKAGAEVLIFEDRFHEKVTAVRARLAKVHRLVAIGDPPPGIQGFEEFLAGVSARAATGGLDEADPFCMTYTGGTTGIPKGSWPATAPGPSRRTP